jgi:hypothetical protein
MADEPYAPHDNADPTAAVDDEILVAPRPWWVRVGIVVLAAALLLFLTPAITHLFFPPVNPRQPAPPGHFTSGCWACHDFSASVPVRSFD